MAYKIDELVARAASMGSSDVHLLYGVPPKCRVDGKVTDIAPVPLSDIDCEGIAKALAGEDYHRMEKIGELDLARTIAGERCRINLFRARGHVSCALRILSNHIPDLKTLGLPPVVYDFPKYNKGIILVTGETGSGKSTTLAALLNAINHTRQEHIITLEDPVEYVYEPDKCIINQREVGTDTESYANGLRAILREDPDIILIGEMRDAETIETAMVAAETGHLVFSTLHTNSATDSVDRIVGTFPADRQPQIRLQLSTTLKAILSQQLLLKKGGVGRTLACECMINSPAMANLIREGKTPQMATTMLSNANIGSVTMDNCLLMMVRNGLITNETAADNCNDQEYVRRKLGMPMPTSY